MGLEWQKTVAALTLMAGTHANAAWECKMPNGLTIYKQLTECPADAVSKKEVAQVPDKLPTKPPPRTTPQKQAELTLTPIPGARATLQDVEKQTQKSRPTSIQADPANAVCLKLRVLGATTCDIDFNLFSVSTITATVPANPETAQLVCLGIANETRKEHLFQSHWELQLHNPYSVRPIASCRL